MKIMKANWILALALLIGLAALPSCNKENGMNEGNFKVAMTDAPADYASLDVEIKAISIYSEESGWITINHEVQVVNVLSLANGVEVELAYANGVEVGHYTRLMITFGDNNHISVYTGMTTGGGFGTATFSMNYAGEHEIIIETDVEVKSGAEVKVLLDFDAARSVIESAGQYTLKPVLRVLSDTHTGLRGKVKGTAKALVTLSGGGNSFSTYANATGEFLLRGMEEGIYTLEIVPGPKVSGFPTPAPIRIEGVVVTRGEIREMGQFQF